MAEYRHPNSLNRSVPSAPPPPFGRLFVFYSSTLLPAQASLYRFIIADATKCIGCRTCEVACAVSHHENQDCAALSPDEFISRIRVIKDHCWTTAVACHQCEDAPCANVCPVDAISREHGHIFVEQTRCIGCKSCMLACPFGAMEVVSSRKKARAIKCDLCWHRETGPACVEACPTKALQCMDVEKVQRHRLRQQPV